MDGNSGCMLLLLLLAHGSHVPKTLPASLTLCQGSTAVMVVAPNRSLRRVASHARRAAEPKPECEVYSPTTLVEDRPDRPRRFTP